MTLKYRDKRIYVAMEKITHTFVPLSKFRICVRTKLGALGFRSPTRSIARDHGHWLVLNEGDRNSFPSVSGANR